MRLQNSRNPANEYYYVAEWEMPRKGFVGFCRINGNKSTKAELSIF
jgi:hypothetical protein